MGVVLVHDGVKVGNNMRNGAGSEIGLVNPIALATGADVHGSDAGHGSGFQVAESNDITFVFIATID